ncbi:MAG TPA: hypothetical protein EYQ27_10225 [Gemmatimonadetes bacterium]|nr:hypothetical protein [Gemmatimonadota bacterium]
MSGRFPAFGSMLLVAAVLLLGGCYTYQVVDTPPLGSTVRVRVPVTSALDDRNTAPPSVAVEGAVLQVGDTLVLARRTRREFGAFREVILLDTLRLLRAQTSSIELKEFASGKSVVLGIVIVAGATGLALAGFKGGGGDGETPGVDPPNPSIVVNGSILAAVWDFIWKTGR